MHGLAVYVNEGLPVAWDLSLESSADSHVFNWNYFTWLLLLLPILITFFVIMHVFVGSLNQPIC